MRATSSTGKEMGMEFSILKMVGTMKANGKTIKCMVLGNSITRMERLPTKDIGKTMNSTVKDVSITQSQFHSRMSSIIKTFHSLEISGSTTRASSKTTPSMVKDT
jgi:hypothetical protein